ncbi:Protein kinase domain [Trypanosoma melophagium]|uniref:Protein kinase domain n=1 Tax=Trypanosoma melophagium TaxID=715481 RepID=UPI00351AA5E9|nr:Protein kinase domain [Trypanosoma melophagium]
MDKFTKVRNIGKGNMGACVLARNNEDGKFYVIKQVDLSKMNRKERQQSLNEAHVLSSLRHPNIINYVDSFISRRSDHLCIVMEFADSGDLSSRIKKSYGVNFRESQVLDWLIQMVLSLSYIHQRKILHRDIKSQNVFLTSQNVVKLGDFGIARTLIGTYDQAKTFVGTPYYLSPELILERPYDHRSDVWALGVVLYELLTLKHPFNANSMKGLMQRILKVQYDPVPQIYTTEIRNIVPRLLTKEPSQRIKLEELLELPIVQRRLREWMLADVMPKSYIDTLLRQGLLPPAIASLRKLDGPSVVDMPPTQLPSLGLTKETTTPAANIPTTTNVTTTNGNNTAHINTVQPHANVYTDRKPLLPPTTQLAPMGMHPSSPKRLSEQYQYQPSSPQHQQQQQQQHQQQQQQQQQQQHYPYQLPLKRVSKEGHNIPVLRPQRRGQPSYLMYKNINGGYNSPATPSAMQRRSRLSISTSMQALPPPRVPQRPPAVTEMTPPHIDATAAGVPASSPNKHRSFPTTRATAGVCAPQREDDAKTENNHHVSERCLRKLSQLESDSVVSCLNPFFHRPSNSPPAPLPYLAGAQNMDIKAMLQRAALERAQRRAVP